MKNFFQAVWAAMDPLSKKLCSPSITIGAYQVRLLLEGLVSQTDKEQNTTATELIFGRDALCCHLRIADTHVSRSHFTLYLEEARLMLKEESVNGTFVNSVKVKGQQVELEQGAVLALKLGEPGATSLKEFARIDLAESPTVPLLSFSFDAEAEQHTPLSSSQLGFLGLCTEFPHEVFQNIMPLLYYLIYLSYHLTHFILFLKDPQRISEILASVSQQVDDVRAILLAEISSQPFSALSLSQHMSSGSQDSVRKKMIQLPHDVILFKGLLDENEQLSVVSICLDLKQTTPKQAVFGGNVSSPVVNVLLHNWGRHWQQQQSNVQPVELFDFARRIYSKAMFHVRSDSAQDGGGWPVEFEPTALNAIMYKEKGSMVAHQDGAVGWVLAFSFGASCLFHYGTNARCKEEGVTLQLESGDAVLFDGQKYLHQVSDVGPCASTPSWFSKEMVSGLAGKGYPGARFNLQFRDPSAFNRR